MPRVSTEISPRIAELLSAGVITISTDWFSTGCDTYGRVTQPHPKLGVYPHVSYSLEELEPLLEKVQVPTLTAAPVGSGPVTPRTTPTKKGTAVSVSTRHDPEIGKVPVAVTIHGVRNALPEESICWKDLSHLSDDQLNARLLAVGKKIGADKAVSRIECMPALSTTPAPTLFKWWEQASPEQRLMLVSTSKKLGRVSENDKDTLLARLGLGQYPFRGTDRKIQEGETQEEEGEESESDLRIDFDSLSLSD